MENQTFIIIGSACLVLGLIVYFINIRSKGIHFHSTLIIGWLLIALFPIFIILPFFPDSQADGKLLNFSFGGALAAFIFIWWFGTKRTISGEKIDKLQQENASLKEELKNNLTDVQINPSPNIKANILTQTDKRLFNINGVKDTKVGVITGSISNVKGIDVWVNSENTNMQMARFYEGSISGIIRYLGAEKDNVGNVTKDVLAELLKKEVGNNLYVHPATVLITESGKLINTHGVKKIYHVASVQGEIGVGYRPVYNIQSCISNVLSKVDASGDKLNSILFPILGTGIAGGNLEYIPKKLFEAAINYFVHKKNSKIREVLFLAYTDIQLKSCLKILKSNPNLKS